MIAADKRRRGLGARVERIGMGLSRDKSDTLLLLGAAVLVLAPHASHLPLWVSLLCAVTLLWRAVVTFRGIRMPPALLLLPVAAAAMVGVYLTFKTILGREAGVAMLVLLVAFKTLEMRARRDLFVVIFLCFFLVLTNFFYSQSIGTALLTVASVVALLTAQLSFQFTGVVPPLRERLRMGIRVVALAAPLALALFVFFPRIQGPLWGLPSDAKSGKTGMSKSMAPGNLASLAQSDEVAFRVKFAGRPPAPSQLYWRGLVLGDFDGRTWNQVDGARRGRMRSLPVGLAGPATGYQVTMEAHNERWLYALDLVVAAPRLDNNPSGLSSEAELLTYAPITQRLRYDAVSHVRYLLQHGEALPDRERWVALPQGFNPRAMQEGLELQREPDPRKRVSTVLRRFAQGGFAYTLEPPALGTHTVDEFMYQTKRGFCEHFSNAFVVLMRAADVPARVVIGYQGGEMNPVDGFMTVRQLDAHAWAEVWVAGQGWIRVDPTASVAPSRVERQLRPQRPERFDLESLNNLMNLDENSWLAQLRYRISAINNGWNQWVLNYTPERQRSFVEDLKSALNHWRTLALIALLIVLLIVARAIHSRREKDPVDALYSALCQQLSRLGIVRASDEGPTAFAARIAAIEMVAARKAAIVRFLELYSLHKYGPAAPDPALVPTLKKLLTTSQ